MKTAHDIVQGLGALALAHAARESTRPTGVAPGYYAKLGAAVTEDGRLRHVSTAGAALTIDAIYTMSTTNTVLGDATPKRVNFNVQEYDPLAQVTTGAAWAFTAQAAGVYIILVNAPLNIAGGVDWVTADKATLSLQGDVNEILATWVGIAIDARPSDLPLMGFRGVPLAVGDVLYAQVVQDCGTDRTIDESVASIIIGHV